MPDIVVDAGPLIALFKPSDRHHRAALAFVERTESSSLVTNMLVIGEVAAMLSDHHGNLVASLGWILEAMEIDADSHSDLPRALAIVEKYRDLPADLADASLVALCERRQTHFVASLDADFEVYRLPKNKRFENVFAAAG